MQGVFVKLDCDRRDPEDYAVVALGDDGNIYPLCPLFVEDIDTFKSAVELGFDHTEMFDENNCLREFIKTEKDPRSVIIYAEGLDSRILGIICYNWVMECPVVREIVEHGVSNDLPLYTVLQEDIKEGMAASLSVFTCQCDDKIIRDKLLRLHSLLNSGSRKPLLMGPGESDILFLSMSAVSYLTVMAIDIIDGYRRANQDTAKHISGHILDLMTRVGGAKKGLRSAESYSRLRQDIIAEQVDKALCVIEDMNAWTVEFEVE